jgi:glutamate carboxypeptidase
MSDAMSYLESRREPMVDLLTRLCNANSYSHHSAGLAAVARILGSEFAALSPDAVEIIPVAPLESVSEAGEILRAPLGNLLSFARRPDAPTQALLVIHYDTVYPPQNPFQTVTREDANTLRGPGVADAKGGIVVMLNALLAFEQSPHAKNIGWRVLLNPDEEIGSPGSAPLLAEAAQKADFALVFEPAPTPDTLVTQRKGSGNFSVIFHGRSAHAGREVHKGRNAVLAAARFALDVTSAISAIEGGVTINVGKIDGGGPVNVVPDLAILRFNIRAVTAQQQHQIESVLSDLLRLAHRDDITAALHGHFSSPPWVMDEPAQRLFNALRDCGKALSLNLHATSSGGASDANKIASTGLPVLDSLGPVGSDIHSPNERIAIASLVERAKLSALLLMKIAQDSAAVINRRSNRV